MRLRTPTDFGALIRERRRELGLDQRELAERIGVSRQWVVEIEAGKPRAEIGLMLRALDALGVQLTTAEAPSSATPRVISVPDIDAVVRRARKRSS